MRTATCRHCGRFIYLGQRNKVRRWFHGEPGDRWVECNGSATEAEPLAVGEVAGEPLFGASEPDPYLSRCELGFCVDHINKHDEPGITELPVREKWRATCGLCLWSSPPYWSIELSLFEGDAHHDDAHPTDIQRHANVKLDRVEVLSR
jgi:hypothetical protein